MRKGVVAVERRVGVVGVHDRLLGLVVRSCGVHGVGFFFEGCRWSWWKSRGGCCGCFGFQLFVGCLGFFLWRW